MNECIFPGSFDPITIGHINIINRAREVFDKVTVLLLVNNKKQSMFSTQQRLEFLQAALISKGGVAVGSYDGLLTEYCRNHNCFNVVRGIRNGVDFEFEMQYFGINRLLEPRIEMLLLPTLKELLYISSGNVRELLSHGSDVSQFVPEEILPLLKSQN